MPTIRALAEDAAGGIWVGSEGGGLDRFDPGSGNFAHYRHSPQPGSLPDNRVQALLIDRQGTLWVGTWAGLSRRRPGSDRFEPVFSAPGAGATISPAASSRPCSRRRTGASGWGRSRATWRSSTPPRPGSAARRGARQRQPGRRIQSRRGAGRSDVGQADRPGSRFMTCATAACCSDCNTTRAGPQAWRAMRWRS
jgi:hypothetical protein